MSKEKICLRRPTILSSFPERRWKTSDHQSIEYSRLMTNLSITRSRLMKEEQHSADLQEEIDKLKARLEVVTGERNDAKRAFMEEKIRNKNVESKFDSMRRKIEDQATNLEECQQILKTSQECIYGKQRDADATKKDITHTKTVISGLMNTVRLATIYNGIMASKLIESEREAERVKCETRLERDAALKQHREEISALCGKVTRLEEDKQELKLKTKMLEENGERFEKRRDDKNEERVKADRLKSTMKLRYDLFNEIQDLCGNVRVMCRVRPQRNKTEGNSAVKLPDPGTGNAWKISCEKGSFAFSHVFHPSATNCDVYSETAGVVEMVMGGTNVCVLAYGQTGSGKTHTMDGTESDPGVNILALKQLFALVDKDSQRTDLSVSILEIYNDTIQDLLTSPSRSSIKKRSSNQDTKPSSGLQIKAIVGRPGQVHVPGLISVRTETLQELMCIMKSARERRAVASTKMNTSSSRSHLVIEVSVRRENSTARLNLVDLAGSERVSRSMVQGKGLKEAIHINKSLSALANVFSALEKNRAHIPYRDCKLTHFLQNSIGGDARTLMFITISADLNDKKETLATLKFGQRVSGIVKSRDMSDEQRGRLKSLEMQLDSVDREIRSLENDKN